MNSRKVVREFTRRPQWAEKRIAEDEAAGRETHDHILIATECMVELECGHIKRDPYQWGMHESKSRKVRTCVCLECETTT